MCEFTTLVFKSDTPERLKAVREMSRLETCRAWSTDHEILRLELIEKALDEGDIQKAQEYISSADIQKYRKDLVIAA